jgi:hypothetical protein
MITRGLGVNNGSFLVTRGLGVGLQPSSPTSNVTYTIPVDKQILFNRLLSGIDTDGNLIKSSINNQDFIEKSSILANGVNCSTITCSFINKGTTDDSLDRLTIDEIVYAIVDGSMQIVYHDGNIVYIRLVDKKINKPVKGTATKNKPIGSNVSTGKMIE